MPLRMISPWLRMARPRITGSATVPRTWRFAEPPTRQRSADHVHITGRAHGEIERDVLAEAMRRWSLNTAGELVDEFPEIKGICKRKVGQVYRSPEGGSLWGARKSQICINAFAQSLEVQHSDALLLPAQHRNGCLGEAQFRLAQLLFLRPLCLQIW